jgi:hypothetical protein
MATTAATKTVSDGIQAVQARLRLAGDGRPRLYPRPTRHRRAGPRAESAKQPTGTVEEIPAYVWDRPREGSAAAEKAPKEEPRKLDDHGLDATGTWWRTWTCSRNHG